MSDSLAVMTQKEMMRQLYELQKVQVQNDAVLKVQMDELVKRVDRRDETLEKISETLSEQKTLLSSITSVEKRVEALTEWKNEREKRQAVDDENLGVVEKKIGILFKKTDEAKEWIEVLENKDAQTVFALVKKISMIVLGILVTTGVGYFLGKF